MLDALEFLVQSLSVARNLAEVSLDSHELLSGAGLCILDDVFRKSHLAGQLEGKRVARQTHLQLEKRCNVLYVEHHRSVQHSGLRRSV